MGRIVPNHEARGSGKGLVWPIGQARRRLVKWQSEPTKHRNYKAESMWGGESCRGSVGKKSDLVARTQHSCCVPRFHTKGGY